MDVGRQIADELVVAWVLTQRHRRPLLLGAVIRRSSLARGRRFRIRELPARHPNPRWRKPPSLHPRAGRDRRGQARIHAQLPSLSDWSVWLFLGGRSCGKTYALSMGGQATPVAGGINWIEVMSGRAGRSETSAPGAFAQRDQDRALDRRVCRVV